MTRRSSLGLIYTGTHLGLTRVWLALKAFRARVLVGAMICRGTRIGFTFVGLAFGFFRVRVRGWGYDMQGHTLRVCVSGAHV